MNTNIRNIEEDEKIMNEDFYKQFDTVLDNIPSAVILCDKQARVSMVNNFWRSIYDKVK